MKSKKGQTSFTMQNLVVLLLFMIIVIFVYSLWGSISDTISGSGDIEKCRLSILAAAKSKQASGGVLPLTSPQCERQTLEIKYGDVIGDDEKTIDPDKVHKVIADAMTNCNYMMGEGKLDPFSEIDFGDIYGQAYCFSCYDITFDKKLKKFFDSTPNTKEYRITHPIEYLSDHTNPRLISEDFDSYFEYLTGRKKPTENELKVYSDKIIEEGTKIGFRMYRDKDFGDDEKIFGFAMFYPDMDYNQVIYIPYRDGSIISSPLCTIVYN